jgi:hypothetical protein
MTNLLDYPVVFAALSFLGLSLTAWIGARFSKARKTLVEEDREGFAVIQAATLTLLGLIIGFTFSMALNRYDQRKNLEEAEANAIGTEYVRLDLLPQGETARARALLETYLDQRIQFYRSRDLHELQQVEARTVRLQGELWSAVKTPAVARPEPVIALAVAGMNDVLNAQGYTQAAWWNRIPASAWALLVAIAVCANLLVGLGIRSTRTNSALVLVLPLVVAIAFLLIADIDSPRRGLIRVVPENLLALARSLHPPAAPGNPPQADRP